MIFTPAPSFPTLYTYSHDSRRPGRNTTKLKRQATLTPISLSPVQRSNAVDRSESDLHAEQPDDRPASEQQAGTVSA